MIPAYFLAGAGSRRPVIGDVEDAADVGVGDLARQLDLAPEAFDRQTVGGDLGAHRLERDALAQLEVLDLVDLAHAALRQEASHPVAAGDDLAGGEDLWRPAAGRHGGQLGDVGGAGVAGRRRHGGPDGSAHHRRRWRGACRGCAGIACWQGAAGSGIWQPTAAGGNAAGRRSARPPHPEFPVAGGAVDAHPRRAVLGELEAQPLAAARAVDGEGGGGDRAHAARPARKTAPANGSRSDITAAWQAGAAAARAESTAAPRARAGWRRTARVACSGPGWTLIVAEERGLRRQLTRSRRRDRAGAGRSAGRGSRWD